jgi:hypothetical protein
MHLKSTIGKEEKMSADEPNVVSEFLANVADSKSAYKNTIQKIKLVKGRKNFDVDPMVDKDLFYLLKKKHPDYGRNIGMHRYNKGNNEFENVRSSLVIVPDIGEDYEFGLQQTKSKIIDKKKSLIASLNIKGKKSVEDILVQAKNIKLNWMIFISYIALLIIFALAIVSNIYLTKFLSLISIRIKLIDQSYKRLIDEQVIILISKEILLVQK